MDRKSKSEKVLEEYKIKINPNLPRIESEDEAQIKSPEEIVKRAVTAFLTAQIAIDIMNDNGAKASAEFFMPILERFGLTEELTDDEKPYFDLSVCDDISIEDANEIQWRIEMCVVLFWACGFREDLDFPVDDMSDTQNEIQLIGGCKNFDELMSHVKMRSPSEILDMADLLFRADWACVEARLHNDPSLMGNTGELFSDVVVEQHKGVNWLIGAVDAEDWDNVRPHT